MTAGHEPVVPPDVADRAAAVCVEVIRRLEREREQQQREAS